MAIDQRRFEHKHDAMLRDVRPLATRFADGLSNPSYSTFLFIAAAMAIYINDWALVFADLIVFVMFVYFLWLTTRDRSLPFKLPLACKYKDKNNGRDGRKGKSEGILYLGNTKKNNEEVWFTNSDIRTHILYLGTTGAGKTEGLKSLVTNAMAWGSGFVYVDGKADTDLWSSLSSLVRRFGRDDDLLVLNYMTGNSDVAAPSNTMNPFSSGSASYLTNMLVSLMPESGGDNAMWKERAVSLVGAMMPALTWKRDNQEIPMSVRTIRDYLSLNNVIKLSRDDAVPKEILFGLVGYLDTLPGFIGDAYDDDGKVKPPGPDTPQYNTETASQQHGYLAMQFTRSLQSLGDDYGYIFDTQAADVDMVDIVLNRRILVVLVPALEKSGDEVANLGKIVSASIKGMMGSALGSTVEGSSSAVIENKPTHSSTPFMTVFDEVGYYVAEGMAVMAAQARSLGFSLVFAGQDLPALKKRVREEANSITANCNIKLFGKLEDPTETKEFFEKTVGSAMVTEVSGFQMVGGSELGAYHDTKQAGVQLRPRANYETLRGFKEGQAVITYGETVVDCAVFYSNPGFAKAMRVTRYMSLPPADEAVIKHANAITKLRDLMVNKNWTAKRADVAVETSDVIVRLHDGFVNNNQPHVNNVDASIAAMIEVHSLSGEIPPPSAAVQAEIAKQQDAAQVAPAQNDIQPEQTETQAAAATAAVAAPLAAQTAQNVLEQQEAQAADNTKPSIFGGAPKAEPEAPQETSQAQDTSEAKPTLEQASQTVKENIFGAEEKPQTPQEQGSAAPQKPSIFGGAPKSEPEASQEMPPAAQASVQAPEEKPAEKSSAPVKPAIFGTSPTAPPETEESTGTPAKPSIFGGAPKAEPEAPQETSQAQDTPEVPKEADQNTDPATSSSPDKEDPPQKPAIFGKKPEKPADDSDV